MAFKLKKPEPKESEILSAVCEYLEWRKHLFFRVNNIPVFQPDGHGSGYFRRLSKWALAGVPDVILIDDTGHFIGLEIKRPSGKQSPAQKEFQRKCEEKGAEYYLIKSVEQLQEIGL